MNEVIEIHDRLANLYQDAKQDNLSRQYLLSRIRAILIDLQNQIDEYDRYNDEMSVAEGMVLLHTGEVRPATRG